MSEDFVRIGPNGISSSEGFTVETLGRTGVRFTSSQQTIVVDAEMFAPDMTIALYLSSIPGNGLQDRDWVAPAIVRALEWRGFKVETIE